MVVQVLCVGMGGGGKMESGTTLDLEQVDDAWLRAWVDAGIISNAVYEAEMRRRANHPTETTLVGEGSAFPASD